MLVGDLLSVVRHCRRHFCLLGWSCLCSWLGLSPLFGFLIDLQEHVTHGCDLIVSKVDLRDYSRRRRRNLGNELVGENL